MFVLAQIGESAIADKGIWDLIWGATFVVQFTLLILLSFSVASWAIIFYKFVQVRRAQKESREFWTHFSRAKSIAEIIEQRPTRSGPLYEIFDAACGLMGKIKGSQPKLNRNALTQKMDQVREEELYKLEQYTPFLATTASTAPFIGLFGTVWGILTAFWAIGKAGSSSLATVGPYISEALIATAIGLAAAIPAVVAYNYFVHRIKILAKMMDLFVDDLLLKLEEEF